MMHQETDIFLIPNDEKTPSPSPSTIQCDSRLTDVDCDRLPDLNLKRKSQLPEI